MRKLIAGMQTSVDEKIEGPDGYADWVESWSDSYDVLPRVDACVLGAGMYPGYEGYWTAVHNAPDKPLPMTNRLPTSRFSSRQSAVAGSSSRKCSSFRVGASPWSTE